MSEITRKGALCRCLEEHRKMWAICSVNYDRLIPVRGMEKQFMEEKRICENLQALIQACDSEPVRAALHDWQKMIIREDAAGKPHQLTI